MGRRWSLLAALLTLRRAASAPAWTPLPDAGDPFPRDASRNGQEIASGIHLDTVLSDGDRFEDSIGKFVVVR